MILDSIAGKKTSFHSTLVFIILHRHLTQYDAICAESFGNKALLYLFLP